MISTPFVQYKIRTYVISPLDPCLELRQAEVNLDTEHNCPVSLATFAGLRLRTPSKGRQVRANVTQGREIICERDDYKRTIPKRR